MSTQKSQTPDISIIVPLYNEEESLGELITEISTAAKKFKKKWELVCIDDGSSDKTAKLLSQQAKEHSFIKPLYLRRNYGQTAALQAGFDHASGEIMITMDGDLQNDPADIPYLLEVMQEKEAHIVSGWRKDRKDNKWIRTLPSRAGNWLISKVTGVPLHDYGCTLKAYHRDVIEDVRIYGELHRFIPAVIAQYGARIVEVEVNHRPRQYGSSKYGIDKTFRVILDLLAVKFFLKYLHRPMHAFGMTGLLCLIPGIFFAAYLTVIKLFMGQDIGSRPLLLLAIMLILIGIQLIGMGILGELLVRIYHEPGGRKQYTLKSLP